MTRERGWMLLRKEERLRPAERSRRRVASPPLKGEIKTARLAKLLPPALEAYDPCRTTSEEPIPHARRRAVGRAGALSEEGGNAAGAP